MALKYNNRTLFVFAVVIVVAASFWSGSRYPSLDEKSIMGGSARLEDPLSFEASIQIQPSDGVVTRIVSSTINWLETNLEGMAFGLMIGACLLTLIGLIPARAATSANFTIQMNNEISGVHTLFVPSASRHSFLASKLIREIARFGGDVTSMVPAPVAKRLSDRLQP